MHCILGVIIIFEENDKYKVVLFSLTCFIDICFVFLNSQIKCFLFPQKFCVVYLVIKRRSVKVIKVIYLNICENLTFLANKGNLLF